MANGDRITAEVLKAQNRIFRLAQRDHGLTLKAISIDSGIPYNTIRCYAGNNAEQSVMSIPALIKLIGVIPDDLLSQLLELGDRHLEKDEDEDSEYDDLADHGDNLARLVRQARHPASPGGTEIIAVEEEQIKRAARGYGRKQTRLRVVA